MISRLEFLASLPLIGRLFRPAEPPVDWSWVSEWLAHREFTGEMQPDDYVYFANPDPEAHIAAIEEMDALGQLEEGTYVAMIRKRQRVIIEDFTEMHPEVEAWFATLKRR